MRDFVCMSVFVPCLNLVFLQIISQTTQSTLLLRRTSLKKSIQFNRTFLEHSLGKELIIKENELRTGGKKTLIVLMKIFEQNTQDLK